MVVGFIPARGGSKGVPGKNLRVLGDKSLLGHAIHSGMRAETMDAVVVSSDDPDTLREAQEWGAGTIQRPAEMATDDADVREAEEHAMDLLGLDRGDIFVRLQPTSPLRTPADIDYCVRHVELGRDAVVSIQRMPKHPNLEVKWVGGGRIAVSPDLFQPRQDYRDAWCLNGAVYAARVGYWRDNYGYFGDETYTYGMSPAESIDIDDETDFRIAEALHNGSRQNVPQLS